MPGRFATTPFLRFALLLDAVASCLTSLIMIAGSSPLAALFGLPQPLVLGAGLASLPFAACLAWLGTRAAQVPALVWFVVIANALWVVASLLLLVPGWLQPTVPGMAFVLAQATAVAIFAELQFTALRKALRRNAAPAEARVA